MQLTYFQKMSFFSIWFVFSSALFAQTYNITGKVVDGSSKPIKGAAVHLLKADKLAFTNDNGEFTITDTSRSVKVPKKPYIPLALITTLGPPMSINKMYDVKGALKAIVPPSLSNEKAVSGSQNPLFPASGIYITEAGQGGKIRYGKIGFGGPWVPMGSHTGRAPRSLKKAAAADELVISAMGKTQQRMDISDFGKDVGTIKLSDNGKETYHGYTQLNFKHEGRDAFIVLPETPHPDKPWIWRTTFWDDSPEVDLLMASKGYYLVYVHVRDLLGNDEAVGIGESYYDMLVKYLGFWPKAVVSGWSQAGFIIFRFSAKNADKVSVVFADAATCNIRAWPKGPIWGMSRQEAEEWKGNPSDSAVVAPMVKGGVAVIHEVRKNDGKVTPDWTYKMQELYQDMGGVYEIIARDGGNHVPHMQKPEEIAPFIIEHNPLPDSLPVN